MAEEARRKQFTFRGKTLEELKKLDIREFSKFLKSKQKKFALRHFSEIEEFVSLAKSKIAKKKPIRTHIRKIIVVPEMVGMKIQIYNGRTFVPVEIMEEM